jgi:hypothetical protein
MLLLRTPVTFLFPESVCCLWTVIVNVTVYRFSDFVLKCFTLTTTRWNE